MPRCVFVFLFLLSGVILPVVSASADRDAERQAEQEALAAAEAAERRLAEIHNAQAADHIEPVADNKPSADDEAESTPAESDASDGQLPEPISDEEAQLVALDEVEAALYDWQSITDTATVNLKTGAINRNLNFNTHLVLPEDTRVISVGSQIFFTSVLDENGEQMLPVRVDLVEKFGGTNSLPNTRYYALQKDGNHPSPYRQVQGHLNNIDVKTGSLKLLEGYIPIRVAAQSVTIDRPYAKTEDYAELLPGLLVLTHEIRDQNSYYDVRTYFARPDQDPNQNMEMDRDPSVSRIELLDQFGEPLPVDHESQNSTSFNHNGVQRRVYSFRSRFRKMPGQNPTTLRYHAALRLIEAPVKFSFEDVPLP